MSLLVPTMHTYARVDALPKTSSGKVQKRLLWESCASEPARTLLKNSGSLH
jgi:acyl-coenzyme A synthetase/AMP-(fatty) acid ligase